ncbi:hypothetical protein OAH28_04080 [Hyphomicrobiales bacterium]|nr:hypothetical protein [Hyphomicrobiales bacterium]
MSEEIRIPEKVTSTPYEDDEHPSIRFNIKENDDVTKHLLFYKTDKEKSFSEELKLSDVLMDAFMEIQTLPIIKNKKDKNDIETFNKFIKFINQFIPHLVINSNSETNVVEIDDSKKDLTTEKLHETFKVASKGKRKAMLDKYINENQE